MAIEPDSGGEAIPEGSQSEDHDQRCKELLEACFPEFMDWVRPGWGEHFRFERAEWLRQEIFGDPPTGDRLLMDLVAKVPAIQSLEHPRYPGRKVRYALFHTEIENSKSMVQFRPRVAHYNFDLERRHGLPVFSQALLLKVGLEGIGRDEYTISYFNDEIRRTGWRYLGLPALDGMAYIQGENILATALSPLMKIPKGERMQACAMALEKIYRHPGSHRKRFLLGECVQAYFRLDRKRWEKFRASLTNPNQYAGANEMVSLIYKEGEQKGEIRGEQKGQHVMFLKILKSRFPSLDAETERQARSLSVEELDRLLPSVLSAKSLSEIEWPKPKSKPKSANANGNGAGHESGTANGK